MKSRKKAAWLGATTTPSSISRIPGGAITLHVAVWILVACVLVLFLRLGAEAVVPFVLSVLLFYALDPAVDALQRWRVPRAIGAALMLGAVLTGVAAVTFTLRDDVAKVIAELALWGLGLQNAAVWGLGASGERCSRSR